MYTTLFQWPSDVHNAQKMLEIDTTLLSLCRDSNIASRADVTCYHSASFSTFSSSISNLFRVETSVGLSKKARISLPNFPAFRSDFLNNVIFSIDLSNIVNYLTHNLLTRLTVERSHYCRKFFFSQKVYVMQL